MSKRLRIIAGPNGSGKSRLYEILAQNYIKGSFINADSILRILHERNQFDFSIYQIDSAEDFINSLNEFESILKLSAIWHNLKKLNTKGSVLNLNGLKADAYFAGATAQFLYYQILNTNRSFAYETVMSDKRKLEMFNTAMEKGYKIYLYFICTDSPEINKMRVHQRVIENGHDVPDSKIENRYYKTIENLKPVLGLVHRAFLFDNSGIEPKLFAELEQGNLKINREIVPFWFQSFYKKYF